MAGEFWSARPWARVFDLISGAYGWTDDQILDLPFARVRQLAAVLAQRETERDNQARAIAQTAAQHLVAATYSAGGAKPGQAERAARKVRLIHRTARRATPRTEQVTSMLGATTDGLIEVAGLDG